MADSEPVVYRHTVEAFLSRVFLRRGLLSGELVEQLRVLNIDPTRPRDVPVAAWRELLLLAARTIAPTLPEDQALAEVGREMIHGFEASVVGKTLFLVMRLMGIKRALQSMAKNYETADNATKVTTREVGPTQLELRFNVDAGIPFPTYTQAILTEGAKLVSPKSEPRVTYNVDSPTQVTYLVSW